MTWSGGPKYLVQTSAGGYELVVDLIAKTCACKKWQLSGIPCFHAVACMNSHGFNLQDGIHHCYSINKFKKVVLVVCLSAFTWLIHCMILLHLYVYNVHIFRCIVILLTPLMVRRSGKRPLTHSPCLLLLNHLLVDQSLKGTERMTYMHHHLLMLLNLKGKKLACNVEIARCGVIIEGHAPNWYAIMTYTHISFVNFTHTYFISDF